MPSLHALPALDRLGHIDTSEPDRSEPDRSASGGPSGLLALAPPGRILELSGQARTTLAARLLAQVQASGDPVAWVTTRDAGLYPPDLAEAGIDLRTLVIVQLDARSLHRGPQAAELLLRTGAFGAVVLDSWKLASGAGRSGASPSQRTTAWQGRLSGILRTHDARLILLSHPVLSDVPHRDELGPSMGPLVSVRLGLYRERQPDGELVVRTRVLKDKSGALAHRLLPIEPHRGPAGSRLPCGSADESPREDERDATRHLRRVR